MNQRFHDFKKTCRTHLELKKCCWKFHGCFEIRSRCQPWRCLLVFWIEGGLGWWTQLDVAMMDFWFIPQLVFNTTTEMESLHLIWSRLGSFVQLPWSWAKPKSWLQERSTHMCIFRNSTSCCVHVYLRTCFVGNFILETSWNLFCFFYVESSHVLILTNFKRWGQISGEKRGRRFGWEWQTEETCLLIQVWIQPWPVLKLIVGSCWFQGWHAFYYIPWQLRGHERCLCLHRGWLGCLGSCMGSMGSCVGSWRLLLPGRILEWFWGCVSAYGCWQCCWTNATCGTCPVSGTYPTVCGTCWAIRPSNQPGSWLHDCRRRWWRIGELGWGRMGRVGWWSPWRFSRSQWFLLGPYWYERNWIGCPT